MTEGPTDGGVQVRFDPGANWHHRDLLTGPLPILIDIDQHTPGHRGYPSFEFARDGTIKCFAFSSTQQAM